MNNAGVTATKPGPRPCRVVDWDAVLDTNPQGRVAGRPGHRPAHGPPRRGRQHRQHRVDPRAARHRRRLAPYATSKAAVVQLTKSLALEWAPLRNPGERPRAGLHQDRAERRLLRVRCRPGADQAHPAAPARGCGRSSTGPLLLLASEAGAYMTGSVLAARRRPPRLRPVAIAPDDELVSGSDAGSEIRACSAQERNFWILPVEVFGNGPEHDRLRHLEPRHVARDRTRSAPARSARSCSGFNLQERARALAPGRIRPRRDGRQHHCGVAHEHLLHLQAGDILAARDDDVLRPVLDLHRPVGMPDREVAGPVPAVGEGPASVAPGCRGSRFITVLPRRRISPTVVPSRGTGTSVAVSATLTASRVARGTPCRAMRA